MTRRPKLAKNLLVSACTLWALIESGYAADFIPLPTALEKALATKKVKKKTLTAEPLSSGALEMGKSTDLYYVKDGDKVKRAAFVDKGMYKPGCTHTWVIGINPDKGSVTDIQVVEMSCPHAHPTREARFLDEFKGMGPADAGKIKDINTVAKATGSSELLKHSVKRVVSAYAKAKGTL
jgi:hypothetical protein